MILSLDEKEQILEVFAKLDGFKQKINRDGKIVLGHENQIGTKYFPDFNPNDGQIHSRSEKYFEFVPEYFSFGQIHRLIKNLNGKLFCSYLYRLGENLYGGDSNRNDWRFEDMIEVSLENKIKALYVTLKDI